MKHRASRGQLSGVIRKKGLLLPRLWEEEPTQSKVCEGVSAASIVGRKNQSCKGWKTPSGCREGSVSKYHAALQHTQLLFLPGTLLCLQNQSRLQHVTGIILTSMKAIASLIRWGN